MRYEFIKEVPVTDPDSKGEVVLEVWKDMDTGGIFAVDWTFMDQNEHFYNPFEGNMERCDSYIP